MKPETSLRIAAVVLVLSAISQVMTAIWIKVALALTIVALLAVQIGGYYRWRQKMRAERNYR